MVLCILGNVGKVGDSGIADKAGILGNVGKVGNTGVAVKAGSYNLV